MRRSPPIASALATAARAAAPWRVALPLAALLALGACAAPAPPLAGPPGAEAAAAAADWAAAPVVTVTLDEFAFTPAELVLPAGRPVRLRFENTGGRAHDWSSAGFFRAVALRPGDAAGAAALAAGGSVVVPAGAAREVALLPLLPGRHAVTCDKPLHATLGMTGSVSVVPAAAGVIPPAGR